MARSRLESEEFWRLCDRLSISEAADLIVGMIPGQWEAELEQGNEFWPGDETRYRTSVRAAKTAIINALIAGKIEGTLTLKGESAEEVNPGSIVPDQVDIARSTVDSDSLKRWLQSRGVTSGLLFPDSPSIPDYQDINHPRYAPKLAAAVRAWESVTDTAGKSPKQALKKWLREHASEFGLTDDDGRPNETGIEEIAKVATWRASGGAPKTPSK